MKQDKQCRILSFQQGCQANCAPLAAEISLKKSSARAAQNKRNAVGLRLWRALLGLLHLKRLAFGAPGSWPFIEDTRANFAAKPATACGIQVPVRQFIPVAAYQ